MSYGNTITTSKSPRMSYEIILRVLPDQGFKIVRRRDIANLVQGGKEINTVNRVFNISCLPGKDTKISVTCLVDGETASADEIAAVDTLLIALDQALSN
jgi:hypothetical protein